MVKSILQNREKQQVLFYNGTDFLCAFLLFIACIFYRPMILGNEYTPVGIVLFFVVILLTIVRQRGKIRVGRSVHVRTYICTMSLFVYCLFQCIFLDSDRMLAGIQTSLFLMLAVTAFYVCFANKSVEKLFIKINLVVMLLFVCSYLVSVLLVFVVGWDGILIKSIDYGYFTNTNLYFPFTTTYGEMFFNGIRFYRLLGFARECGIMQVFFVWGFFLAEKFFNKPRAVQLLMIVGVIACLSTSGFVVFGISLLLYFDFKKLLKRGGATRVFVIAVLVAVMVYILFYADGTKIADRAQKTITDRIEGIEYSLAVFRQHPVFGGGFYSTLGNANIQTGICAIASLGHVGIVGVGIWLLSFFYSFADSSNKKRFIFSNAALFITAVFAQPLMFAPVMYWFIFVDYNDEKVILKKLKTKVW